MTEIYNGMDPREIDELPIDRVQTDLMMYQIREQRRAELTRK